MVIGELAGEARGAAEALFLHNQRLVHKISQKYPATGMAYEDLAQFGFLGLIRAVEKFDPTARLQVLDLCDLVDPAVDHPRDR